MSKVFQKIKNHPQFQNLSKEIGSISQLVDDSCELSQSAINKLSLKIRSEIGSLATEICLKVSEFNNFEGNKKAKGKLITKIRGLINQVSGLLKESEEDSNELSEVPKEYRYNNARLKPQTIDLYDDKKLVGQISKNHIKGIDWKKLYSILEKMPEVEILPFMKNIGVIAFDRNRTRTWNNAQKKEADAYLFHWVRADTRGIFTLEVNQELIK